MSYRFRRKESVRKAIRRLGCDRFEHAIKCLRERDHPELVHGARKDIKKIRALLHLARTQIPQAQFRRPAKLLRNSAAVLSPPRDAYVKAEALRKLAWHFKRELSRNALGYFQPQLRARCDEALQRFQREKGAQKATKLLQRGFRLMQRLRVKGSSWKALAPGLKNCHRAGRCAYLLAREKPSATNFHEWRKCAKDLWYHTRLLRSIFPREIETITSGLDQLDEYLGDDHDLAMLALELKELRADHNGQREFEALNGLIQIRQGELRTAALSLGVRFYGERSSVFCNRIAGYWEIWRKGKRAGKKKPTTRTAAG